MCSFIVFEGLNGSGKTTLAKALASRVGGVYISSPPALLSPFREMMDNRASHSARFFYYLLGNVLISDEVRSIRKSHIVVCDRFLHSTLARHKLLGLDVDFSLDSFDIEAPDISFFVFTSDESERRQRVERRGKKTKWDRMDEDETIRKCYVDYFRQIQNFVFVDTSHETEEESLARIKAELSQRGIIPQGTGN